MSNRLKRGLVPAAAAWLWLAALMGAHAQSVPQPNKNMVPVFQTYTQVGRAVDIAVTSASFDEVLPTTGPLVTIYNLGSQWGYVGLSNAASSITAATGIPVAPGSCAFLNSTGATHVQAITSTGTTTLQVSIGWGNPGSCGGGGGGGGGGGSGAVFGPTAVGSAIANPPVVIGGSQNGLSNGLVAVWKIDSTGLGYINCANCTGSGASAVDSAAFAAGTSVFAPSGYVFNDGLTAMSSGTQGTGRMTSFRAEHVNLRNNSGTEIGTASNPVQVSLANTAANTTAIKVDGSGVTQPISGTVTSNVGTGTRPVSIASAQVASGAYASGALSAGAVIDLTNLSGPVAPNTATASKSAIVGGVYNTTQPTFTNTQQGALQASARGALIVGVGTEGFSISNSSFVATQPAAASLNATVVGTGTFAVQAAQSGSWTISCSNCSGLSTTDTAAFTAGSSLFAGGGGFFQTTATNNPLNSGQQGMFQLTANRALFTNLRNASGTEVGTASAPLQVSLANTAANGTALLVTGTGGTFPITAASLPLPSGAATSANQPTNVAIGSTTSGQTGRLSMAAVQVVAPSLIDGQTNPLSLTTAGALRVDNSGVIQPVSGTIAFSNTAIAVTQATASSLNATVVNSGTFAVQAAQSGTWNVTNISGTVSLPTGASTAANQTSVIGSATGGTAAASSQLAGGIFNSSPITLTNGQQSGVQLDANGFLKVNVVAGGGSGGTSSNFGSAFPGTGTAIGFSDGTNMQPGRLKAASTAPVAADPSIVVTQSPNSALFSNIATTTHTCSIGGYSFVGCLGQLDDDLKAATGVVVNGANSALTGLTPGTAQTGTIIALNTDMTSVGGTALLHGAGAVGSGSPRVAVAQDTTTIAGSAPGTAGTASSNVLSVQGIASMIPVQVSQATAASLNATVVGTGTFAVQLTGATNNINNISGTISLPTGASTSANQTLALGSATGGTAATDSQLAGGIFNSAAPTLTNGQQAGLQLDTNGSLKVNVVTGGGTGGTSSTFGSSFPTLGTAIGFTDGTNMQAGVIKAASTAPLTTDRAIVVAESPNSFLFNNLGTTTHTCSVAGYSTLGCLGQLDDDVKGPMPANVNGTATGVTGLTPGTAQTGTIVAFNADLTSVGGNAIVQGVGAAGNGAQRVAVGQDNTTIAGSAPGTAGTASANVLSVQGVASMTPVAGNTTQVNGVAVSTGSGVVGTGTQRVAIGGDSTTIAGSAPGTAGSPSTNVVTVQGPTSSGTPIPSNTTQIAGSTVVADPCQVNASSQANINLSASGAAQIIAGTSSKKIYICHMHINNTSAEGILLIEGTGTNCATSTTAVEGGTTAGTGWNFAANGGISIGFGSSQVLQTSTAGDAFCLNPSASTQLTGSIKYVVAP